MNALVRFLRRKARVLAVQLGLLIAILAAWEYIPKISGIRQVITFADPYFISSPSEIWNTVLDLAFSRNGSVAVWPYLWQTVFASVAGVAIGTVTGALAGLWLSNSPRSSEILRPFIVALNAVPRIALIPVFVIILGPTLKASMFTAVTVVFFIVFFNAYEGGRTVPAHVLNNAHLLGASNSQLMYRVRWRYVLAWTLASLPNAVSLGLITAVTAEILTGTAGMGRLILNSVTTVDSGLTFAVVVILSVLGSLLVGCTSIAERRWQRWWNQGEGVGG